MATADMSPDFISLDMAESTINASADAPADDFVPLEMDAPIAMPVEVDEETPAVEVNDAPSTLAGTLAAIVAPVTGNASLANSSMAYVGFTSAAGYVTALANGVKAATADQYKATLKRRYQYSDSMIEALTITILPEVSLPVGEGIHSGPANSDAGIAAIIANRNRVRTPVVAPRLEGILPRAQVLRDLAEKSPGVKVCVGRADRRQTHHTIAEITSTLGEEFSPLAPKLKSSKAQFGETMRGIKAGYESVNSQVRVWNVSRRDVARTGEEWPSDLATRWCVGLLDGSASLGTLGAKTLIADLLVDGSIRFVGGSEEIRDHVITTFADKVGGGVFNSTDLMSWFRKVLSGEFNALEVTGGFYIPGDHPTGGRLDTFASRCREFLGRDVQIDDVITGSRLSDCLTRGLASQLQDIETDYQADCVKAGERDVAKLVKTNPNATEADCDLARRRAVVLQERANHYLVRLVSCQEYLTGLATLIGDDTAAVKATLARLDGTIRPLADVLVVDMD